MEDFRNFTINMLKDYLEKDGYPQFYARQVFNWVYKKRIKDFSLMTDLSKQARDYLKKNFYFSSFKVIEKRVSRDGTQKFLFSLSDGDAIESVVIPEGRRLTLCVSTQVGCKFGCRFCVSGIGGFKRNLKVSEIINQFLEVEKVIEPSKITNIVFMGIGEPLDNFDNLVKSIEILTSPYGIYFGKKRICISTCGIPKRIRELVSSNLGVRLSISLHASCEEKRSLIMPVNKRYSLREVVKAAKEYAKRYKFPVTFEYILIKGVNSSEEDAYKLARLIRTINCKVNLIPYNPSSYFNWQPPSVYDINRFKDILKKKNVFFTLRKPRGQDIEAACGQLRRRNFNEGNNKK